MAIYFVILLLCLLATLMRKGKGNMKLAVATFIIMMLLCGLRGINVGIDTSHYYSAYTYGSERMEPTFQLISFLCHAFGFSFKGFLMCYAILTFIPLLLIIRKTSNNIGFSILIFLSFSDLFYHETFNTIRVSAALSYVLFSFYYMERDDVKKSIVYLVIAVLFHYTAIVVAPFLFLFRFIKKVTFLPMFISVSASFIFGLVFATNFSDEAMSISSMLSLFSDSDLTEYYQRHLTSLDVSSFNLVGTLSKMLPFSIFAICMYDKENSYSLFYKLFLVSVVLQNVFVSVSLIYRITMYFLILIVFILPNTFERTRGIQRLSLLALSLFMILWYGYQLITADDTSLAGTIPYQF